MNILLHEVKGIQFEIHHGDTLTNDCDMLRETNPAKKQTFDAVVADPPFRAHPPRLSRIDRIGYGFGTTGSVTRDRCSAVR
jgi:type I restriction-modification system DNA methylase subunit